MNFFKKLSAARDFSVLNQIQNEIKQKKHEEEEIIRMKEREFMNRIESLIEAKESSKNEANNLTSERKNLKTKRILNIVQKVSSKLQANKRRNSAIFFDKNIKCFADQETYIHPKDIFKDINPTGLRNNESVIKGNYDSKVAEKYFHKLKSSFNSDLKIKLKGNYDFQNNKFPNKNFKYKIPKINSKLEKYSKEVNLTLNDSFSSIIDNDNSLANHQSEITMYNQIKRTDRVLSDISKIKKESSRLKSSKLGAKISVDEFVTRMMQESYESTKKDKVKVIERNYSDYLQKSDRIMRSIKKASNKIYNNGKNAKFSKSMPPTHRKGISMENPSNSQIFSSQRAKFLALYDSGKVNSLDLSAICSLSKINEEPSSKRQKGKNSKLKKNKVLSLQIPKLQTHNSPYMLISDNEHNLDNYVDNEKLNELFLMINESRKGKGKSKKVFRRINRERAEIKNKFDVLFDNSILDSLVLTVDKKSKDKFIKRNLPNKSTRLVL